MSEWRGELLSELGGELVEPAKQATRALGLLYTPAGQVVVDTILAILQTAFNINAEQDQFAIRPNKEQMSNYFKWVFAGTSFVTMAVSEDAAEVLTESASEAFSNAIYSGFGGLWDMLMRLNIGGQPPQDFAPDLLDPYTRALLDALYGIHFHVTMLTRLANDLQNMNNDIHEDGLVQDIIESYKWARIPNVMQLSLYGESKRAMFLRLLESVASTLEGLLQRAQDAVVEYKAAEIMYNNGLIDEAKFDAIRIKAEAELDAIENELQALQEDLAVALATSVPYPENLDTLYNNLRNAYEWSVVDLVNYYIDYQYMLYNARQKGRPIAYQYVIEINGTKYVIEPPITGG